METVTEQPFVTFPPLSEKTRRLRSDPHQTELCPLADFVGNVKARNRLGRAVYEALGDPHHRVSQQFAFIGPASTGKTTLVSLFAKCLELPFVVVEPKAVKSTGDILEKIFEACAEFEYEREDGSTGPLEIVVQEGGKIVLPPMVVLIDEVHALGKTVVDGLLKPTEPKDGQMDTGEYKVDCRNVCWCIATTDRGLLFDAFDTRFTKVTLNPYTTEEVATMISDLNPDWDVDVCRMVAKYGGRTPREAFGFVDEVRIEAERNGGDFRKAVEVVAEDNDIDQHGMTRQRVKILAALGQRGPISQTRMVDVARCKEEELAKFVMPPLLVETDDQQPLVRVTSRGYVITRAGMEQLDLRGIPHKPFEEEE
jgi:Holliday junction resolvasome RuvABC ATP-dependent DNA helicase subunit